MWGNLICSVYVLLRFLIIPPLDPYDRTEHSSHIVLCSKSTLNLNSCNTKSSWRASETTNLIAVIWTVAATFANSECIQRNLLSGIKRVQSWVFLVSSIFYFGAAGLGRLSRLVTTHMKVLSVWTQQMSRIRYLATFYALFQLYCCEFRHFEPICHRTVTLPT